MVAVASLAIVGVVVGLPYLPSLPAGGTGFHWHANLRVTIDGQAMAIPPNVGIDPALWNDHTLDDYSDMRDMPEMGMGGMAPLHTHSTDGRIHIESRVTRDYTIGEFFRIWGQSFDGQQALGHAATSGHRVWMVVDGSTMSPSYSVVLRNEMQIQIVCGAG